MPSPRTKPSLTSLVAFGFCLLPIVYVLSYAPIVRFSEGPDRWFEVKEDYPLYHPVDWLIEQTPVREPFLGWAGIWGVRDRFQWAMELR